MSLREVAILSRSPPSDYRHQEVHQTPKLRKCKFFAGVFVRLTRKNDGVSGVMKLRSNLVIVILSLSIR